MKTTKTKKKSVSSATIDRMANEITRLDDQSRDIELLGKRIERIEGEVAVKFATIEQVSALFVTLRKLLSKASAELAVSSSYTQKEIAEMSADDYREKVLVPLGMGRRV